MSLTCLKAKAELSQHAVPDVNHLDLGRQGDLAPTASLSKQQA